jgi:hypothetical protein
MRIATFIITALAGVITAWGQAKQEPIKVHGHWVVEIKNPNGKLAARKEFENSLVTGTVGGGDDLLSAVLTGAATPGEWIVQLNIPSQPVYFLIQGGVARGCPSCNNLTVSTANGSTQIILQGVFLPIAAAGTIASFGTGLQVCANTATPSTCFAGLSFANGYSFSGASVSGMTVTPGQLISVTVTFSFS